MCTMFADHGACKVQCLQNTRNKYPSGHLFLRNLIDSKERRYYYHSTARHSFEVNFVPSSQEKVLKEYYNETSVLISWSIHVLKGAVSHCIPQSLNSKTRKKEF